jgi:uncharacterized membrane protein YphA (DoxX/SURF4 family)
MNVALWVVQVLLAVAYLAAGVMKASQPIDRLSKRMAWTGEVSPSLVRFIGIAEVLGGLGLILPMVTGIAPSLTIAAAVGLVLVQLLAFAFHASRGEVSDLPVNVVFLLLAVVIVYGRLAVVPA